MERQIVKIVCIVLGLWSGLCSAQTKPTTTRKYVDEEANAVLKAVQTKMTTYVTICIDFTIHTIKNEKIIDEISGKIQLKGQKYILDISSQKVFCDAVNVWTYLTQQQEVTLSSYQPDDTEQFLNPSAWIQNYQKQFKAQFIREETQKGVWVQIIDLTPLKSSSYYKIRLYIDKSKKQLTKATIYQKDDLLYTYFIDKFIVNQPIEDSKFVFDLSKYPHVELIDLR
jgi:outer membrane lipoprotein-sorting protein